MNLIPYTWNGYAINDWYWNGTNVGEWSAGFPVGQRANLHSSPIYSEIAYAFPKLSTTQIAGHSITLQITPKSKVAAHTLSYMREQLKGWAAIKDFQSHQIIAKDAEDSNRQWYLTGIPTDIVQDPSIATFYVTFALDDPIWRVVTSSTTGNVVVVASPNSQTLTVLGNTPAAPIIAVTPNSARTGSYGYRRWIPICNTTANAFPFPVSSVDLTFGGLNTAALVAAVKMLANGNDLRIFVDGVDTSRWFGGGGINSVTTTVWANIPHSTGALGTLSGTLPNNSTTVDVPFQVNATNLATLTRLSQAINPVFVIGSEAFTYNPKLVNLSTYTIPSCKRAQKLTSAAAHSDGDTVTWIEHDVWMLYGNASASAPAIFTGQQPNLNLTTSTNLIWKWTTSLFQTTGNHPAAWKPVVVSSITNGYARTALTNYYTGDATAQADPATESGMKMLETTVNAVAKAETANLYWSFYHPAGFTNTSMLGKKFLLYGTSWPAIAGLLYSTDNVTFLAAWNETIPVLNTATAFSHNAVALGATYQYLRLNFAGSIGARIGNNAYFQGDTVSLTLGASVLSGSLGAENSNYQLTARIKNTTSGEYVDLNCLMGTGQTLTIDCGAKTVTLSDGTNLFNAVTLSGNRINADWLNIGQDTSNKFTGTAVMTYTQAGLVNDTLNYNWTDASY